MKRKPFPTTFPKGGGFQADPNGPKPTFAENKELDEARFADRMNRFVAAAPSAADQNELEKALYAVLNMPAAKAMARVLGMKRGKRKGEQWFLLESLQLVESIPGRGPVRLDNSLVQQVIVTAIRANDWDCLHALSYWHKNHKPCLPDLLELFMVENWKELRHLSDFKVSEKAKAKGIDFATRFAVRDRRLRLCLKRPGKRVET